MKLSRPANLSPKSRVRTIFLPSSAHIQIRPNDQPTTTADYDNDLFDRNENYLRRMTADVNNLANLIAQVNQNEINRRMAANETSQVVARSAETNEGSSAAKVVKRKRHRRRNDKFLHRRPTMPDDRYWLNRDEFASNSIDYVDCVAVGWGKYRSSGDLSDALLKIEVPIQNIKRCVDENKNNPSNYLNSHRVETHPFSHPLQPNLPNTIHLFTLRYNLPFFQVRRGLLGLCFATSEPAFVRRKHEWERWHMCGGLGWRPSVQNGQERSLGSCRHYKFWVRVCEGRLPGCFHERGLLPYLDR